MREADIGTQPRLPGREHMATRVPDYDEYADIISIYDDIDDQAVSNYEGLDEATQAVNPQPHTPNDYDRLGAADTDKSTEHIEMSEFCADNNDKDAVSKLFLTSSSSNHCHLN